MRKTRKIVSIILAAVLGIFAAFSTSGCASPEKTGDPNVGVSDSNVGITSETDALDGEVSGSDLGAFSMKFIVDEAELQLPCKVSDFGTLGWTMDEHKTDRTLAAGDNKVIVLRNEDSIIVVNLKNSGDADVAYADAVVTGITVNAESFGEHKFTICDTISLGSTKEDVAAIYGEPSINVASDSDFTSALYQGSDPTDKVEFSFNEDAVIAISLFVVA